MFTQDNRNVIKFNSQNGKWLSNMIPPYAEHHNMATNTDVIVILLDISDVLDTYICIYLTYNRVLYPKSIQEMSGNWKLVDDR